MSDTNRQIVLSPQDLGEKDVFVINDINLVVPPSQINVQKEDLVYKWRTLRTKAATKIPTGHGQMRISCSIVFPQAQLLAMHRLLVQFRQSPFCYIDNRFLRETIVPDWPANQNMAFTMLGMSISPLSGSSDSWVCELDMQWMSYFPFMHNWLYREEWQTNWLNHDDPDSDFNAVSYTIGHRLNRDTHEKIPQPYPIFPNTILTEDDIEPGTMHNSYNQVLNAYADKQQKTIWDMEIAHAGVEFDLVPLPDNMRASRLVTQPKHSLIYVRFMNLLQRDALMKNFGIDVDTDLFDYYFPPPDKDDEQQVSVASQDYMEKDAVYKRDRRALGPFFGDGNDEVGRRVYGLHTGQVPRALRKKWIGQMLQYNHGIRFHYHTMKDIRFPAEWTEKSEQARQEIVGRLSDRFRKIRDAEVSSLYAQNYSASDPGIGYPIFLNEYPISSKYGWRVHPKLHTRKHHDGIDFAAPGGTPIYSPVEGVVLNTYGPEDHQYATTGNLVYVRGPAGETWAFMHLRSKNVKKGDPVHVGTKLGLVGSTGRSTGNHLHLGYWPPNAISLKARNAIDPTARLTQLAIDMGRNLDEFSNLGPLDDVESQNLVTLEINPFDKMREDAIAEELPNELHDDGNNAINEIISLLSSEGWSFYNRDTTVLNIWEKLITIEIAHSGLDLIEGSDLSETFLQEGVVLTNVGGALTHIVANLPVLSQEFPTHQHLGSIEPQYSFEFAVLDDQSNLEGISQVAQHLQAMRSILQKNARKFRPVPDGWAISTDTFITRLFGSYEENDILVDKEADVVVDSTIKKRTVISATNSGTVEGNPGLSIIQFNVEETNPYEQEELRSTQPQLAVKEEAREELLNALWSLDFINKYKEIVFPVYLAQISNSNLSWPNAENYGEIRLNTYNANVLGMGDSALGVALMRGDNAFIVEDLAKTGGSEKHILIKKSAPGAASMIEQLYGVPVQEIRLSPVEAPVAGGADVIISTLAAGAIELAAPIIAGVGQVAGEQLGILDPDAQNNTLHANMDAEFYVVPLDSLNLTPPAPKWKAPGVSQASKAVLGTKSMALFGNNTIYSVADILDEHPQLADIPVSKILEYHRALVIIVRTANRMMAEEQAGGLPISQVHPALYNLPILPRMWQSWQVYIQEVVQNARAGYLQEASEGYGRESTGNARWKALYGEGGRNWPVPGGAASWNNAFDLTMPGDAEEVAALGSIAFEFTGPFGSPTSALAHFSNWVSSFFTAGASAFSKNINLADSYEQIHTAALNRLVNRYIRNLPLTVNLTGATDVLTQDMRRRLDGLAGDLIGDTSEEDRVPSIQSMYGPLYNNVYSCGNFTARQVDGNPYFQIEEDDPHVVREIKNEETGSVERVRSIKSGALGAAQEIGWQVPKAFLWAISNATGVSAENLDLATVWEQAIESGLDLTELTSVMGDSLYETQAVGKPLGSPFEYKVETGAEQSKLRHLKRMLAAIADDMILNPDVLRAFGMEELALQDRGTSLRGSECYPDLALPTHPYYGDSFQVYPDFYMWNIYEDGGALDSEDQEKIYRQLDAVVQNCYNSMETMKDGEEWNEGDDLVLSEAGIGAPGSVGDPIAHKTQITPEGSDSQHDGAGPTSSPFAQTEASKKQRDDWTLDVVGAGVLNSGAYTSDKPSDWLTGLRISSTEGDYGSNGGEHYPMRAGPATYAELKNAVEKTEQMFGDRAGFNNEHLTNKTTASVKARVDGTNLEVPLEYSHSFDPENLKKLARDSAKDLFSRKMSLRRAFPTFKLYFVEEDEFESRFLNFDDFYSYNAVKEFSVVMNRKLPADHAVIVLQNVSGTLDGTRRNAIVDLDYVDDTAVDKLEARGDDPKQGSSDPFYQDTAQDQPFGAVVLRPGLNVQLRAGYSNDPDNLHVLVSGRIVDVSWNKTGDLAEIMVQSFGTELIQAIKGTARDDSQKFYRTTHELLGAMMMEPEVVHFGRWEFGQLFQIGESRDYRLDFTDYSKDNFFGGFKATNAITGFLVGHPYITMSLGIGAAALNAKFPFGRIFGGSAKAAGFLSRIGIAAPIGKTGAQKLFVGAARKVGGLNSAGNFTKGGAAAAAKLSIERVGNLARVAQRNAGTETYKNLLTLKAAEHAGRVASGVYSNPAQLAAATAKMERYFHTAAYKGQWFAKPELYGKSGVSMLTAVGTQPLWTGLWKTTTLPIAVVGAGAGVGLGIDTFKQLALDPLLDSAYKMTIGKTKQFFTRKQVHLFLSPQDDNLFPPHPKDYMTVAEEEEELFITKANKAFAGALSRILTGGDTAGDFASRFFEPDRFFSKKMRVADGTYKPQHTSIWDIFHEMSLRHPGWIYGPRPYGTAFRYTMFFGTPSQRYWSKGASNRFVDRMNRLYRHVHRSADSTALTADEQTTTRLEASFRGLYGDSAVDNLRSQIINSINNNNAPLSSRVVVTDEGLQDSYLGEIERLIDLSVRQRMLAIPMREYLRGLSLRFVPFRRYHLFTSEQDIIWNGIISSENAVTNAVDVTYWERGTDGASQGNLQTSVFKAHSFIPENQLRIAPVRHENCFGYQAAMRYGTGELLHRLREMYRGEFLIIGNPRVRPWDIGIIVDTYNDMVGPVEVEQVVHNFSHETGFVTELKPAAVVFANETSGWPMVEAMKMFALAVRDIENRYAGIKLDNPEDPNSPGVGFFGDLAEAVNTWSAGMGDNFDSFMEEKYKRSFGLDGATLEQVFGGPPPNAENVDGYIQEFNDFRRATLQMASGGPAGIAVATGFGGSLISRDALLSLVGADTAGNLREDIANGTLVQFASSMPMGAQMATYVAGLSARTGYNVLQVGSQMEIPSLAFLVGGPLLFLQCLRNDAITVVPLMKSGHPIVSGLSYNDPGMIWNNFRGELSRYVDDTLSGTKDMLQLYQRYGSGIWNRLNDPQLAEMTGGGV